MSDRLKFFKSKRGHSPAPPGGPSRPSASVPSPQDTAFPAENDTTTRRDHGGSDGFHLKPPTAAVSAGGSSRDPKQRRPFPHVISKLFSRKPNPDPTHIDQSTSFDPRQSDPSVPDPPSPNLSPSTVLPEGIIYIPDTIPSERIINGNNESSHPQSGVNLDTPLLTNLTQSSSAVPARDRKKTIIATTRHVLQTAASALKLAPIPNLDQIPTILLSWLQVYEVRKGVVISRSNEITSRFHAGHRQQ
ncbi:uncharacterized protein EI90DRAFT_172075 [Cantharellus anzutake]|uniref:uncharacterized protein n=1 Tax=Cantharellus anzutake TaxID=1750568 RepID=UPI001907B12B|nr:uncharacterized protein EI90DRAFT_172075 [Cantharellus anzutake]KAF8336405.1 hypothetical protein EI90DRAFT_172075 [Cantharellus anzutake]